jgi:hypothetical protein
MLAFDWKCQEFHTKDDHHGAATVLIRVDEVPFYLLKDWLWRLAHYWPCTFSLTCTGRLFPFCSNFIASEDVDVWVRDLPLAVLV